jgi:predicted DNA-binding transcriptional regulator YafY
MMTNVATRLLSLILLMQKRPGWKAAELAAELGVSQRTILRYMDMLDELGIPLYSERGPNGGFSLVRGYKLPPLIFSPEEATVLYMGANLVREVWGQTYGDAVTSVTAKLDNVLPDDLREDVAEAQQNLVVLAGLTHRDIRPWEQTIHTLRRCIGERRCARLLYHGRSRQENTARTVEPYALALLWGTWYLVGFCRLRQEIRTFRLDRIRELAILDERFVKPRDFSVREYLERTMPQSEPAYRVVVHIAPGAAMAVRERHGDWMELTEHEDGSLTARYAVAGLDWSTGWVLGLGAAGRVLEPPELIARVCASARAALGVYEKA